MLEPTKPSEQRRELDSLLGKLRAKAFALGVKKQECNFEYQSSGIEAHTQIVEAQKKKSLLKSIGL